MAQRCPIHLCFLIATLCLAGCQDSSDNVIAGNSDCNDPIQIKITEVGFSLDEVDYSLSDLQKVVEEAALGCGHDVLLLFGADRGLPESAFALFMEEVKNTDHIRAVGISTNKAVD